VDLISSIGFGASGQSAKDILGQVYEYFLGQFASAEGKKGGQFYTPASIVQTLVAVLAPHHGKVYDPCCGSGGMFVQSEKFIEAHGGKIGDVSIYGQESNPTTWRLAAMNLAIRGIDFNLGKEPTDTFTRNQHPDLRADFVLANPPFNISDWWHGSLEGDPRWVYGTPPARQRQLCLAAAHALSPETPAGPASCWPMARCHPARTEGDIRRAMVEADVVEVMVAMPGQLFFNTQIPGLPVVSRQAENHPPGPGAVHRRPQTRHAWSAACRCEFSDDDIARIANTVHAWRGDGETEQSYADIWPASAAACHWHEIAEHGHVLTPGPLCRRRSSGRRRRSLCEKMARLTEQLGEQMAKGAELDQLIRQKLGGLGYEF
jgi:type I restriction enzyme M protein